MTIFTTSQNKNPINRSKQKFVQLITSAGPPSRPKFIMIGRRVAAQHVGEVVGWRSFLFRWLLGQAHSRPERSSPTYYTSIDADSAKDVPFGGLIDTSYPKGVIPQKPLLLGTSMNISICSLNVYGRISAQDKHITKLESSKCASLQDTNVQ
jgi:hypothetical protein